MSTIEIQFDKKIDNSRIRRDLDSLCSLEYLSLTLLGAMFVFGALFYGWQQYQWIRYGYRIEEAQTRIEVLAETNSQLKLERASLASPQRIDQTARSLGMTDPDAGQIVTLDTGYLATRRTGGPGAAETQLARRTDN